MVGAGASCFVVPVLVSVSLATRGQADMRGLATAGRCVRLERDRLSSNEHREGVLAGILAAHRCFAGRSTRCHRPGATKQL